jgi:hypothetical protein
MLAGRLLGVSLESFEIRSAWTAICGAVRFSGTLE